MDEEMKQAVLQILIDAAEFGDELEPMKLWNAIGENPDFHLSNDAKHWWR